MYTKETIIIPFGKFEGRFAHELVEKESKYLTFLVEQTNLHDAKKDLILELLAEAGHVIEPYQPQAIYTEQEICELVAKATRFSTIKFIEQEKRIFLKDGAKGHYVYLVAEPGFYTHFLSLLREGRRIKTKLQFPRAEALAVTEILTLKRKLKLLVEPALAGN